MTVDNFPEFAVAVAGEFQKLVRGEAVFVADVDGDALFATYLESFPEGTNPVFKKRTEHDCSCCKQFIRRAGAVVAVGACEFRTVWDAAALDGPGHYREVANRLRDVVRAAGIRDIFRVGATEAGFGTQRSLSLDAETGRALTWDHFFTGEIPRVLRVPSPDAARGDYRTTAQVFERGLIELTPDAVATVLSLVEGNTIYRGEEHRPAVAQFQKLQREYLSREPGRARDLFVWANAGGHGARFRNTVIGTLVQDLSEGQDIERAVKSYETKVAPQNYKRTTALITPGMVKQAMKTIEELGLESALERRFATIEDVSVNDVKWVDGSARPLMKGGIGAALMKQATAGAKATIDEDRVEEVGLDDFVACVLPEATGLEILFKGEHVGNLMSITAPAHPEPKKLFRWGNDFAWTYGGNVADSIRERVKKAGGKVEDVALRVSLSWFNYDDLDLHVVEPAGRGIYGATGHIFFGAKVGWTGGRLDVDMNAGHGTTREAVENVHWQTAPPDGAYRVIVHNYTRREASDPGFVIEVESGGKLSHYSYNKGIPNQAEVAVATLYVKGGLVERVEAGDPGVVVANVSQEKWGLRTEQFAKVRAVMLSPNYWGGDAVGNKHTFFVLEGARNEEAARGFYNEFLHPRLEPHRKVFEVIADKTKCPLAENQLSGLGFSSTKKDSFVARVQQGRRRRVFNVRVGA